MGFFKVLLVLFLLTTISCIEGQQEETKKCPPKDKVQPKSHCSGHFQCGNGGLCCTDFNGGKSCYDLPQPVISCGRVKCQSFQECCFNPVNKNQKYCCSKNAQ